MKRIFFSITVLCLSFIVKGQGITPNIVGCDPLKNIGFKNGLDTLEVTVIYLANFTGNQELQLRSAAEKKQISLSEYLDKDYESSSIEFTPINCSYRYQATLSRKIYDKTYIIKTHNIKDYKQDYVNFNELKTYQRIRLKCIVFEREDMKTRDGDYFFTVIDVKIL